MLTNEEIKQRLIDLPSEIAREAEKVEDSKFNYDKAVLQFKASEAGKKLELKAIKVRNKKVPDKYIDLTIEKECLTEKVALLHMEVKYKKAKIALEKLIKEHDSMKAVAYLKQREAKSGID